MKVTKKIVIYYYNKKINIPSFILLLIEDIWNLWQSLNIYVCDHVYREGNRNADCLTKKWLSNLNSNVW